MNEQTLFAEALERTDARERAAFLDQACQGDPALRERIERLLVQHDHAGDFLKAPAAGLLPTSDDVGVERAGMVIGPYKLIEQIGEGGMGAVWMAQQTEPVKRLVAVKLIKAGMDSKQVVARFEAERQALALMDHPNIAHVLDGGTTEIGRPYFVMDLVKGVPITKYCDEHHLTPRQRLELFIPVCQAVQHAHQKGIIHRDLKPSNVLVAVYDGRPVPKVIDFGVAKAAGQSLTDKTLVTGFGNIVGTLEYMSPEQAEVNQLDIDTRSDIYSLGVLLYELLTGSPPFSRKDLEKAGMLEMLRVIREQEPSKPSTKLSTAEGLPTLAANRGTEPAKLTRLVRGELDWIVMKALEKDQNRRYETANGFAMDVQRYLADEAVQACPPSTGYRVRKFVRRNKGALAVVALVLFFLVVLGSGIGWAVRDRSAREADAARERTERQARSMAQVELILADVGRLENEGKWDEARAAAKRAEAVMASGEAGPETQEKVWQALKGLDLVHRLEQIRMARSAIVDGGFDYAAAVEAYGRAFREFGVDVESLPADEGVARLSRRRGLALPLAAALDDWVYAWRVVSRPDADGWKRLVAVARGIDPDRLRDRLRASWGQKETPELQAELRGLVRSLDARRQAPATMILLARTLNRDLLGELPEQVLRKAQQAYPGDFWVNLELGNVLKNNNDEAVRFFSAAAASLPTSSAAHYNLGISLHKQGRLDDAIACYHKAIELDPKYAPAHHNLGFVLRKQGKVDAAIVWCRRAIDLDPKNAKVHDTLGLALLDQQNLDEAIACFRKSIDLDPKSAPAHGNLGAALFKQGRLDDAIPCFRRVTELDPKNAKSHRNLGAALFKQGRLDDAIACIRQAIALDPKDAKGHKDLGVALEKQRKLAEALSAYREAIRIKPDDAAACNNAAWVLATAVDEKLRNPAEAVKLAQRAVELDPHKGIYANTLGVALYRSGEWKAAIAAVGTSMELRQGGDGNDWVFLAMAHWQLGEKDQARQWYDKAVQWIDKQQPKNEALSRFRAEAEEVLKLRKD